MYSSTYLNHAEDPGIALKQEWGQSIRAHGPFFPCGVKAWRGASLTSKTAAATKLFQSKYYALLKCNFKNMQYYMDRYDIQANVRFAMSVGNGRGMLIP